MILTYTHIHTYNIENQNLKSWCVKGFGKNLLDEFLIKSIWYNCTPILPSKQ